MNREIKFRGYDYKEEKWYYGSLVLQNYDNYFLLSSTRAIIVDDKLDSRIVDNGTVGQYTGLKDKNGKEIYEGDIVRIENYRKCRPQYSLLRVDYKKDGFYYNSIYDNLYENYNLGLPSLEILEVVGNIYENSFSRESRG